MTNLIAGQKLIEGGQRQEHRNRMEANSLVRPIIPAVIQAWLIFHLA